MLSEKSDSLSVSERESDDTNYEHRLTGKEKLQHYKKLEIRHPGCLSPLKCFKD